MKKNKKINNKILLTIAILNLILVIFLTNLFLEEVRAGGIIEWTVVSFIFLFVSPYFVIKEIFGEKLKNYFLNIEFDFKKMVYTTFLFLIFIAAIGVFVVKLNWQDSLRISSWMLAEDAKIILFIDLLVLPIVVFSKEFFFRGFLLKKLLDVTNVFWAIFIQAILFLTFELGVSGMMSYKSMLLIVIPNLLFGFIAYKNKSVVTSTIFHWVYLLILDIYFYYQFVS